MAHSPQVGNQCSKHFVYDLIQCSSILGSGPQRSHKASVVGSLQLTGMKMFEGHWTRASPGKEFCSLQNLSVGRRTESPLFFCNLSLHIHFLFILYQRHKHTIVDFSDKASGFPALIKGFMVLKDTLQEANVITMTFILLSPFGKRVQKFKILAFKGPSPNWDLQCCKGMYVTVLYMSLHHCRFCGASSHFEIATVSGSGLGILSQWATCAAEASCHRRPQ